MLNGKRAVLGLSLIFCLSALLMHAQIPTWEERERNSGFSPEYRATWRSGYLQLPQVANPEPDAPPLTACYRKEFNLPAAPRRAQMTLYVPGRELTLPCRFAINGHEIEGPRWGKLQLGGLRNLDITKYLRAGRNVLTFSNEMRNSAGRPPRGSNWVVVEGIVFCEDGSSQRILTDGWRGGWNLPDGWDMPEADVSAFDDLAEIKPSNPLRGVVADAQGSFALFVCPYYGPISVYPVSNVKSVMDQPIFDAEEPVVLDVTLVNMAKSASGERVALSCEILDEHSRELIAAHTLDLAPDGELDLIGRLELGLLDRGAYRCRFILTGADGEIDRRDYEVAVVGKIPQRLVDGTHYEDGLELQEVWRVDCTEEPDQETFVAAHINWDRTPKQGVDTVVTEGPAGKYRALAENSDMFYFAYQYRLRNVYTPHLAIVEWPDDAVRNFIVHLTEETTFVPWWAHGGAGSQGHQRSEASVTMFHDLQPERSGKMQKLHLLFWPNAERGSVHIANIGGGEQPAAAARITIYEITNDLPALRVACAGDRLIGPHSERGPQTMSSAYYAGPMGNYFTRALGPIDHPEFYRNWMTTAENFIKRMRFEGQNLYVMGHLMYHGTLYPSRMSEWGYRQDNYFGADAVRDYVTLLLRMFERNGIYMSSGIEHMNLRAFTSRSGVDYTPAREDIAAGAEHTLLIKNDGTLTSSPNYFHPYIQEGLIAMVGELADLYGSSPAWTGITFILSCGHGGFGPIDLADPRIEGPEEMLRYGYEDYSVTLFEKQTGISIPVDAGDPDRYAKRYDWIMGNAREKWIQWRCDQYTDLWRRMRDRLTAANPGKELCLIMGEPLMALPARQILMDGHYDDPDYTMRVMRKLGFDLPALQNEDGIRIIKKYSVAGSGGARMAGAHEGWRELNRNQEFQSLFANDGHGGAYMWTSIPHYGAYTYPWSSSDESARRWLWDSVGTRQGFFWSTHVVESFVDVMTRSNPTLMPHTWMDVNESMGRIHEKRLFARAYRSLPNGKYERLTGNGLDRNLWVSRTAKDGAEYAYAANLHWWDMEVTLRFESGTRVHDLINDRPVELDDNAWTFDLGPYQIQTFRVERGGFLRRMRRGSAIEGGAALIAPTERSEAQAQFDNELEQAVSAVAAAKAREAELNAWPAWDTVAVLDQRLQRIQELRGTGELSGAYTALLGGEIPMLREAVVGGLLQAMPMLALGPFGKEADTPPDHPRGLWTGSAEVGADFRGMETSFIDEFADADGERLREGFAPDMNATYKTYTNPEARWQMVVNARSFGFAPHAHSEFPFWMVAYAYTEVYSPEEREAVLRVGSDHAIWVWVNDQRIIRYGGHGTHRGGQRPGVLDQDSAAVKLAAGWNRVLVKTVQRSRAQCMLRFTDQAGRPLDDLRYRVPDSV